MAKTLYSPKRFGARVTVATRGRQRIIEKYAVPNLVAAAQVLAGRETRTLTVIQPDGTYDGLRVLAQPSVGRAIARQDGALTLDLQDVLFPPAEGQIEVLIEKAAQAAYEQQTLVIPLSRSLLSDGHGSGLHYMLRRKNRTGALVVEPGPIHRKCYYSRAPEALTIADIAARHGGATINQAFFRTTFAKDGAGIDLPYKYGEREDVKLADDAVVLCWKGITKDKTTSNWLLFERGYTDYQYGGGDIGNARGESEIWPLYFGTFGTGARPRLRDDLSFARQDYCVIEGLDCDPNDSLQLINLSYTIVSDCRLRDAITNQGVNFTNRFNTFDRLVSYDIVKQSPLETENPVGLYRNFDNRHQGLYAKNSANILIRDCVFDVAGWLEGYLRDAGFTGPQPPSQFSHCIYLDALNRRVSVIGGLLSRGALTGLQGRPGWFAMDVMAIGSNLHFMAGMGGDEGPEPAPYAPGNRSTLIDCGMTWGGYKEQDTNAFEKATGLRVQTSKMVARNNFIVHSGPGNDGSRAWGNDITSGAAKLVSAKAGYERDILFDDTLVYGWGQSADENLGALTPTEIEAATIEAFAQELTGNPAADRYAFIDALRASETPWVLARQFLEWMQARLGKDHSARTVGARVRYAPPLTGDAPARRFEYRYAWSTHDRPGTAPGDVMDLDGHAVEYSAEPDFPLAEIDLGRGGRFTQGGQMMEAGGVSGSGTLRTEFAGQIHLTGAAPQEAVRLEAAGGRIINAGSLGGAVDLVASGSGHMILGLNGSDLTIAPDRKLVIKNGWGAQCGWDGDLGQTATLTVNGALRFEPGLALTYDGQDDKFGTFKEGVQVRGETSGFTATVARNWHPKNVSGTLYLENVIGRPVDNENLIGIPNRVLEDKPEAVIAQANGVGAPRLGTVQTFRSGLYGDAAPNVTARVILAAAIEIDLRGIDGAFEHDLILCDDLSGAIADVRIEGLGARNATLTMSPTGLRLSVVEGGSGAWSVV
ncbi:MAG: hypothetical protein AAGK03_03460 [Pseudomonadota bacterium]